MDSREELIARLIDEAANYAAKADCRIFTVRQMYVAGALAALKNAREALSTPSPEAGSAEAPVAWRVEAILNYVPEACRQEVWSLLLDLVVSSLPETGRKYAFTPSVSCANQPVQCAEQERLHIPSSDFRAGIEAAASFIEAAGQRQRHLMVEVARTNSARLKHRIRAEACEDNAAAIRALAPPAGAGGWQPIASAPKDGTEIIGYRPDQGVFVFRWAWMEEFVPKDQHGDPTEPYDEDFACWWHDRWDWMEGELTPTLWQPLPAALGDGG